MYEPKHKAVASDTSCTHTRTVRPQHAGTYPASTPMHVFLHWPISTGVTACVLVPELRVVYGRRHHTADPAAACAPYAYTYRIRLPLFQCMQQGTYTRLIYVYCAPADVARRAGPARRLCNCVVGMHVTNVRLRPQLNVYGRA